MLVPVFVLLLLAVLAPVLDRAVGRRTGVVLASVPALLFAHFARWLPAVTAGAAPAEAWPWVPGLGISLAFRADGLALLFSLLVTGIGALVLVYGGTFLDGDTRRPRFFAGILFFMGAMLGLVLADDAILLFVFWELTGVSSYLLIAYDHESAEARQAALQALLVTGAGGLALLAGLLLLGQVAGTFELSTLAAHGAAIRTSDLYLPALLLVLTGAFTKSAQVPFHFWLPGAMAAPSPVSAYLHSATMVKAGIYLLARLHPALGGTPAWHALVILAGTATLVVGAALAWAQTDLKRLLAFTTVSALGTLTLLVGIGTELAAQAAMVFLLVHALYKAALFLGVGTLDHEAGTRDHRLLGGLLPVMPMTAVAVSVSALSMAGLPPLFGFVAKELFYEAKQEAPLAGDLIAVASFLGSALVAAAAGLVGIRPFLGRRRPAPDEPHEGPPALWLGPVVLATLSAALGLLPGLLAVPLVQAAATAVHGAHTEVALRPWMGMSPAVVQSLGMLAAGALLYAVHDQLLPRLTALRALVAWGPGAAYRAVLDGVLALARWQTRVLQNGVLGWYLLVVVGTTVALVGAVFLTRVGVPSLQPGEIRLHEAAVAAAMAAAAVAVVRARTTLFAVAALGIVGYGTALLFLFFHGPDLALTQLAVETLTVVLFVLLLQRLPRLRVLSSHSVLVRDGIVSIAGGALMCALVLTVAGLAHPTPLTDYFARTSAPLANGRNVVNVILVDFRSLDTLGEITVLAVAALGVVALLRPGARPPGGREESGS
jgi:multicomponent Na+:H+ antiporter subunit A